MINAPEPMQLRKCDVHGSEECPAEPWIGTGASIRAVSPLVTACSRELIDCGGRNDAIIVECGCMPAQEEGHAMTWQPLKRG
jgi:hypothetical protein